MRYEIVWTPQAVRELKKLSPQGQEAVRRLVDDLEKCPFPKGMTKLTGVDAFRIRSGQFRVIYSVNGSKLVVRILKVADRKEAYNNRLIKTLKKYT